MKEGKTQESAKRECELDEIEIIVETEDLKQYIALSVP